MILHADVDAFFAAVEQRDDPDLRGRPVLVGGGVVMAASYEARACGVRGGMPGGRARRLCPSAVVVSPRFDAYVAASRQVFEVFERTAPKVEGLSLEEAFLDVRGLERISGTPVEIARKLRTEMRAEVGLAVSVGIARTKTLAKMASRAAKPDGLLEIAPEGELAFLHSSPIGRVWGIGPSSAEKLRAAGIASLGDAAKLGENALVEILGRSLGRHVSGLAHGRDARPVRRTRGRRSIGSQRALGRRPRTEQELEVILATLVDRVSRRMRAKDRAGATLVLRLRFADFKRASRSQSLRHATASTEPLLAIGRLLLGAAMPTIRRRGITLLGITVTNLESLHPLQLTLPFEQRTGSRLDAALDELRQRYGAGAVIRAAALGGGERSTAGLLGERSGGTEGRRSGAQTGETASPRRTRPGSSTRANTPKGSGSSEGTSPR